MLQPPGEIRTQLSPRAVPLPGRQRLLASLSGCGKGPISLHFFCGTDSTFYNPPFITSERGLAQAEAALIAIARAGLPGLILAGGGPLGRRR
jgi:hypothetical protein